LSKVILERELSLIRRRLESIEAVLAEEMSVNDKAALEEAVREHRMGKSILFKATRPRARKR
jgi:hypothetical protein